MIDAKHLGDNVALFLEIPARTYEDDKIRAALGFDGNYGTVAGPQAQKLRMKMGDGSLGDFDNTEGTHVRRNQLSLKLEKDLWNDWRSDGARHWLRADVRDAAGKLILLGNPIYLDPPAP
ncbi:hypothetical protein [Massilia niastensis]|uniref:hypothetical protein n=1 Tax=Massilia niastensis TaxID=544911 RepID=UPI00036FE8CD|nr:hypothetical protein [Massilia niastensis]